MNRRTWIILIGIILVGIALRWWHIGQASYWYDEFCSLEDSAGHGLAHFHLPKQRILAVPPDLTSLSEAEPVGRIWTSLKLDNHPPMFFILLRWWREIFGSSEAATRSLTALAGVLAILVIYDVGKIAHGERAGLWAAAIFAVAGPQVVYAQELRDYTLAVLWGLCMVDALVRIQKFGVAGRRLLALGIFEMALMLTHYQGIPLAVALGIYVLICFRGSARWNAAGVMIAAAMVYCIIWGPFLLEQRHNIGPLEQGFLYVGEWSKWYSLEHLASLPVVVLGPPVEKYMASTWPSAIVYLLPLLLIRKNPYLLLWFFWILGTAGFLGVMDRIHPSHQLSYTRYILICGPGFYLIFAGLLEIESLNHRSIESLKAPTLTLPSSTALTTGRSTSGGEKFQKQNWWMPHVLPALVVLFCVVSLPTSFAERRWPDWRAIAGGIDRIKQPGDLLVFASDGKDDWFSGEYMSYAFYANRKPENVVILAGVADERLLKQMYKFPGAVIVNGTNRKPEDSLPGYHAVRTAAFLPFVTADRMERK